MKKFIRTVISKLVLIFTFIFIYVALMESQILSLPEIGLYIDYSILKFLYMVVSIIWLSCSSFQKSCCNGGWPEIFYNLVPAEMLLMLVFAQWHFLMAVFAVVLLLCAEIVFLLLLRKGRMRKEGNKRCKRRLQQRYKDAFCKLTVTAVAVICAIPCYMSVFVYQLKPPSFQASDDAKEWLTGEDTETKNQNEEALDVYQENIQLLQCFEKKAWDGCDVSERITVMQGLVDFESGILGIPSVIITAKKLDAFTLGAYNRETKEMWIDLEHLMEADVKECIQTVCHEIYHSYQNYLVGNLDWDREVMDSAYFAELRSWKENEDNYKNAWVSGFQAYEEQPLEAAARDYADEECGKILSYISDF